MQNVLKILLFTLFYPPCSNHVYFVCQVQAGWNRHHQNYYCYYRSYNKEIQYPIGWRFLNYISKLYVLQKASQLVAITCNYYF